MDPARLVRIGLLLLAAGNVAWTVTNASYGLMVNVVTDIVIVVGCAIAALSLGRALDGVGLGGWRTGLLVVAIAHFAQNFLNALDGLAFPDEWTLFPVMLASVLVAAGAIRWRDDAWDAASTPWLAAGFLGIALEPLYFGLRYTWVDPWQAGYAPGIGLVAAGALTAAWGFWRARGG